MGTVVEQASTSSDEDTRRVEHFALDGAHDLAVAEEAYEDLMAQVTQPEQTLKAVDRRQRLRDQIDRESKEGRKRVTKMKRFVRRSSRSTTPKLSSMEELCT